MKLIKNYKSYSVDPDPRRYYGHDMPTIAGMVTGEGVEPDEFGRKIVPLCTFVDKDGKVCKLTKSGFEGEPIGMTHDSKDVTFGPENVALWVRGHFKVEFINIDEDEYSDEIGLAILEKFPEMHLYPKPEQSAEML